MRTGRIDPSDTRTRTAAVSEADGAVGMSSLLPGLAFRLALGLTFALAGRALRTGSLRSVFAAAVRESVVVAGLARSASFAVATGAVDARPRA
jgi:hypothetical protein